MRIEVKGLAAAVIAGLAAVGAAFGVSALVVRTQARPVTRVASTPGGQGASAAAVVQGHAFFTQSCASCHGAEGQGAYGPGLHNEDMSDIKITQVIKNGVPGRMPAFASHYNDTQVQAMVAYIRSLK